MAVRNIAVTDTIEKFRTEFNAMTQNDLVISQILTVLLVQQIC